MQFISGANKTGNYITKENPLFEKQKNQTWFPNMTTKTTES
jgi:hypothetical protein